MRMLSDCGTRSVLNFVIFFIIFVTFVRPFLNLKFIHIRSYDYLHQCRR